VPELPEVEVTRRSVGPHLEGSVIRSARLGKPLRWPLGCCPSSLVGRKVLGVSRRGKYLILKLSQGNLLVHLGMSGRLLMCSHETPDGPHDHFELITSTACVRLRDPRRFGAVVFSDNLTHGPAAKLIGKLGVEPLSEEFTAQVLESACSRTRVSIKQLLLSGGVVAGIGNIYACEALYLAGISPDAPANGLKFQALERLRDAIQLLLNRSIGMGGSSLKDFLDAAGKKGGYQDMALVYGRSGRACQACGSAIKRFSQNQRATYHCPVCQTL
jgi:formamidopyrimidine-DNA glycosylase